MQQSLSNRTAALEKSIGVSGTRPPGMSDREFLRYLSEMPRAQNKLFKAAMSIQDIRSILKSCALLLKAYMPPELYEQFRQAEETGNSAASITILRGYIQEKQRAGH